MHLKILLQNIYIKIYKFILPINNRELRCSGHHSGSKRFNSKAALAKFPFIPRKNTDKNRSGIQQASALKKNKTPRRREKHR